MTGGRGRVRSRSISQRKFLVFCTLMCVITMAAAMIYGRFLREKIYLFIGDSYAARLESEGYSKENVIIYAVPGITAKKLNDGRKEFPDIKPDKVVLCVGINSLVEMTEGNIEIEDEKQLIFNLREQYGVPVYVQKVFPVGKALVESKPILTVENIEEYNRLLKVYCDKEEGVLFFDPQEGFLDEEGYLLHTEDNLHIADDYMELYYRNIMKEIQ